MRVPSAADQESLIPRPRLPSTTFPAATVVTNSVAVATIQSSAVAVAPSASLLAAAVETQPREPNLGGEKFAKQAFGE